MTHYQTLGVDNNATSKEIKRAYKKKSFDYHPDRNKDASAQAQFQLIGEAYSCLSDPHKRKQYDNELQGKNKNPFEDLQDYFYQQGHAKKPKPANDFSATVTLEEACNGCKRVIPGSKTVVQIPAGVTEGSRVTTGKTTIIIKVAKNNKFVLRKHDLYTTLYVDAIQAMVGIDLFINHPDGTKLKTRISAGTQEGQKIRIAGKGISDAGDLYIFCHIVIPDLTEKDKDSIIHLLSSSSAEI